MSNLLPYLEIKPKETPNAVVIFLHGLGAYANEFLHIVPNLELPSSTYFIMPQAPNRPITINQNMIMSGWYDIIEMKKHGKEDKNGILESNEQIHRLIQKAENYVPTDKIFIGGFSQGGAMSIYSGLTYQRKLGGIACLSGYLPINEHFATAINDINSNTNIFMAHGKFDTLLPIDIGKLSKQILVQLGYQVDWQEYPIEHNISNQQLVDLGAWLTKLLNAN